ncbi:MAG TPA: SxtJ family membrane protein [Verrucomicrobiae bacterium]|jgi:hypothetical protein
MIANELKALPCGRRDLRNFGLLVGGIFLLLSAWFFYRHKPAAPYLLIPGAPLFLLGLIAPMSLRRPYLAWMALALVLGLVVSTVLLTVFYFLVMAPIGWIARLTGHDFMHRKFDKSAQTYWSARPVVESTQQRLEQQF